MDTSSLPSNELLQILDITRHMAEQRMVQPLVEFVAATVFNLIPAERCLIALFALDGTLDVQLGRTRKGEAINAATDQVSHSILQQVRTTRVPLIVEDALEDSDLKAARSVRSLGLRSVMCVPLVSYEQVIGVIYAENRTAGRQFDDANLIPLVLFANQVVAAIENARMVERLEQTVAERTRELSEAITHLRATQNQLIQSEKMAALGNMLAGVAHELRNPLNFVNSLAQLSIEIVAELEQEYVPPDQSADATYSELLAYLQRNCQEIRNNGQRANAIITMMLSHTRGDAGQKQPTDVNQVITKALEMAFYGLRTQMPDLPPITVDQQLQADLPLVDAVPQRLSQAWINLFDNACYALRERGHHDPDFKPALRITTTLVNDQIEVRIRDNGTGIAPELRDKLFEPFTTTKPLGQGTGLGLSLTYDILVHGHAGAIRIDSQPNQFTEIIVNLPIPMVQ